MRRTAAVRVKSLDSIRERLVERSAATGREIARLRQDLAMGVDERGEDVTASQHPGDVAEVLTRREELIARELVLRRELAKLDAALVRLADGTFGVCVDCGRAIPFERLEARPEASRDIECEARAERASR